MSQFQWILFVMIASWCALIRVIANSIVAEVVLVCLASQIHKVIFMVAILFSGSSPGHCPGMPCEHQSTTPRSHVTKCTGDAHFIQVFHFPLNDFQSSLDIPRFSVGLLVFHF